MKLFPVFLVLLSSCTMRIDKTCIKCDIDYIANIEMKCDKIEIDRFICTYAVICNKNVEFLEIYNEKLFEITNNCPVLLIQEMSHLDPKKIELIMNQFRSPISDQIKIEELQEKLLEIHKLVDRKAALICSGIIKELEIARLKEETK